MRKTRLIRSGLAAMACAAASAGWAGNLHVTVLDAKGVPLADAVVSVEVKGVRATAEPGTKADLGQKNRTFVPSVLAVQTGTAVHFPNFDTVRHHVYSFSPIKPFEIKLYSGTPAAPIVFDKPGTAVLGCNIHDRMAGFIHVVNTPYFAKTNAAGVASLDVPAGDHTLQVWHPGLPDGQDPLRQPLKVGAGSGNVNMLSVQLNASAWSPPKGSPSTP